MTVYITQNLEPNLPQRSCGKPASSKSIYQIGFILYLLIKDCYVGAQFLDTEESSIQLLRADVVFALLAVLVPLLLAGVAGTLD